MQNGQHCYNVLVKGEALLPSRCDIPADVDRVGVSVFVSSVNDTRAPQFVAGLAASDVSLTLSFDGRTYRLAVEEGRFAFWIDSPGALERLDVRRRGKVINTCRPFKSQFETSFDCVPQA